MIWGTPALSMGVLSFCRCMPPDIQIERANMINEAVNATASYISSVKLSQVSLQMGSYRPRVNLKRRLAGLNALNDVVRTLRCHFVTCRETTVLPSVLSKPPASEPSFAPASSFKSGTPQNNTLYLSTTMMQRS
jgi:hypothetical protein